MSAPIPKARGAWSLDPVLMMLVALATAALLTWTIPSGIFQRTAKGLVKPGTYATVPKEISAAGLLPLSLIHI